MSFCSTRANSCMRSEGDWYERSRARYALLAMSAQVAVEHLKPDSNECLEKSGTIDGPHRAVILAVEIKRLLYSKSLMMNSRTFRRRGRYASKLEQISLFFRK